MSGSSTTLWSVSEVTEAIGMSTRNLHRLRSTGQFPEPVAVVNGGRTPVWDAGDVRRWKVNQPQTREWRRREGVRMYRQGATIAEIARQLEAKPDSIRVWLRTAGELLPSERRELGTSLPA